MKGAACAGYHGNRCTLHSVGFQCRIPEPRFDIIAIFKGMFSVLLFLPSPPRDPPIHSVAWLHYPAKIAPFSQNVSWPWQRQPVRSHVVRQCCVQFISVLFWCRAFVENEWKLEVLLSLIYSSAIQPNKKEKKEKVHLTNLMIWNLNNYWRLFNFFRSYWCAGTWLSCIWCYTLITF